MHATQPQGGSCPEPRRCGESAGFLAGLLSDPDRFRTWLAQAPAIAAAQETYAQAELDQDRIPTREGFQPWYRTQLAELLAHPGSLPVWVRSVLREPQSGHVPTEPVTPLAVPGWCEKCGNVLPWVRTWDEPLCSDCVTVIPALPGEGCEAIVLATPDEAPGTCARVLRSAALYLERHGWIQGAYYDATTGVFTPAACMVGAIAMVCYGGPVDAPAQHFDDPGFLDFEEAVLHLDRYLLVENSSESYEFNDARGRTADQVTYVLRQAAATPAAELIDALRVIDAKNADVAALVQLLSPCGIWGETASVDAGKVQCPSCGRRVPVIDGRLANHLRHPSTPTDNCDGGDPALMGW